MKKILLTAMAATVLFAGCNRSADAPETKEFNIVFSVADKASYNADTKAVKQGWADGDQILLVFELNHNEWLDPENNANTLILEYDGSKWDVISEDQDLLQTLVESQDDFAWFTAIHYPGTVSLGQTQNVTETYFDNYQGGEYLIGENTWTMDGYDLLLGEITMKRPADMFQVSVKGMAQYIEDDYTLTIYDCDGNTNYITVGHLCSDVYLYVSEGSVDMRSKPNAKASGHVIGDDLAFTFLLDSQEEEGCTFELENAEYKFTATFPTLELQKGAAYLLPNPSAAVWEVE